MAAISQKTAQPITIITRKSVLSIEDLKGLTKPSEIVKILDKFIAQMEKRDHGFYFSELAQLDKFVHGNKDFPAQNDRVLKAFGRLQTAHDTLKCDVDIQPSNNSWKYAN